jgi:hypothetical protein
MRLNAHGELRTSLMKTPGLKTVRLMIEIRAQRGPPSSFGWLNRFRRLARDYERLPETLAGLHFVVFAMLMLVHVVLTVQVPNTL